MAISNFFLTEEKYLILSLEKRVDQRRFTVYSFKTGIENERQSN